MAPLAPPQAARPEDLEPAFRLLFQYLPAPERDFRTRNALTLVRLGELDAQGIFVSGHGPDLAGVLVCLPVAGASALMWPPQARDDARRGEREDCLVLHAVSWLRRRGVKLAQTMLAPQERGLARPLERNGFAHVTRLWYLRHNLEIPTACLSTPVRLTFQPYGPANEEALHRTLLATYEATLDCPEVNGVRTVEEVVAGHKAQGRFNPARWWLALEEGRAAGVLLVTTLPESGNWEVIYGGLVPQARRRGLGKELFLKALVEARAEGIPVVTLTVDARNAPAWGLYRSLGFEAFDCREIFLAVWG